MELENLRLAVSIHRSLDITNEFIGVIAERLNRAREYASDLISREHVLSLADQAMVSSTGFLTTVFIARWSDLSQLGIYALGLSLLMSFLGFQDCLILQPYLIQKYRPEGTPAERAGASLLISVFFSAASMLLLALGALGFFLWEGGSELVIVTLAIATIVPFAMARDFARRFAFAHLEMGRALLLDGAAAIIQLSILGSLGASGRMSALGACVALGGACAIPTAIWLCYARAEFTIGVPQVRAALKQTWALGKWLLAVRITVQVQGYATYWISMIVGGAAITGGYAACMSIVGIANPLLTGLANVLMPRSVVAWKDLGGPGLWHEAIRHTVLITGLVVPFTFGMPLAGETVMHVLYHGKEFDQLSHILTVLAAAMSAGALGFPAANGLAVMERPRAIVTIGIFAAVLSAALIWILTAQWGLLGAAYGLLAGTVAGAGGRWFAFFAHVPKVCDTTRVVRVLNDLTKPADDRRWTVARLGEGDEAEVFLANSTGGELAWRTHDSLVVKVYRPKIVSTLDDITIENVQTQFDRLFERHAVLNGRIIDGWTISVPQPLFVCKSPLALVMTAVPGRYIDSYASQSNSLAAQTVLEAAPVVATAMQECWSRGQPYGDFSLDNVLFDVTGKKVSFIDARDAGFDRTCNAYTRRLPLASDVANFLNGIAMNVMDLSKNTTVRTNKELFAERMLLAILESDDLRGESRSLLSEIWFCVQRQLANYVSASWSPRGAWQRFVRLVAMHRIESMLQRVDCQINISAGQNGHEFQCVGQHRERD